jgi:hypothetical protein
MQHAEISRMKITGRCHCGSVTYRAIIDPAGVTICHCTDCQQLTGSAFRVTAAGLAADFELISGAPRAYVKHGESRVPSRQYFCPHCGSQLYRLADGETQIGIRLGSINQRTALSPARQIWCQSALAWLGSVDKLPQCSRE